MSNLTEPAMPIHNKTFMGTSRLSPRHREWRRFLRVLFGRRIVFFGTLIIFTLIVLSIFAGFISPFDPYEQSLARRLKPPSTTNWLGTDQLGRDELSRIIYGSRVSLMVGIIAVSTAAVIGMTLGLLSGFLGRWVDTAIMRVIDALMSIPPILLALAFASALGGSLRNLMTAIGIAMVPIYARLMRSLVLSAREMDFVLAGRVIGATNLRLILRHILPNCFPPMIVMITLSMGEAILIEAGLSFLGLGIAPPGAAWGSMVNDGYRFLFSNPILSMAPGICIMLVVMAFNLVGDGLRDSLDPRLRGKL
jgi:ABC-type dipeptide/oligopeptide/nickel transport system permease subunit